MTNYTSKHFCSYLKNWLTDSEAFKARSESHQEKAEQNLQNAWTICEHYPSHGILGLWAYVGLSSYITYDHKVRDAMSFSARIGNIEFQNSDFARTLERNYKKDSPAVNISLLGNGNEILNQPENKIINDLKYKGKFSTIGFKYSKNGDIFKEKSFVSTLIKAITVGTMVGNQETGVGIIKSALLLTKAISFSGGYYVLSKAEKAFSYSLDLLQGHHAANQDALQEETEQQIEQPIKDYFKSADDHFQEVKANILNMIKNGFWTALNGSGMVLGSIAMYYCPELLSQLVIDNNSYEQVRNYLKQTPFSVFLRAENESVYAPEPALEIDLEITGLKRMFYRAVGNIVSGKLNINSAFTLTNGLKGIKSFSDVIDRVCYHSVNDNYAKAHLANDHHQRFNSLQYHVIKAIDKRTFDTSRSFGKSLWSLIKDGASATKHMTLGVKDLISGVLFSEIDYENNFDYISDNDSELDSAISQQHLNSIMGEDSQEGAVGEI